MREYKAILVNGEHLTGLFHFSKSAVLDALENEEGIHREEVSRVIRVGHGDEADEAIRPMRPRRRAS
jgi:hypothetical protein